MLRGINAALLIRDRHEREGDRWSGPGSAVQRCTLRRVRDRSIAAPRPEHEDKEEAPIAREVVNENGNLYSFLMPICWFRARFGGLAA